MPQTTGQQKGRIAQICNFLSFFSEQIFHRKIRDGRRDWNEDQWQGEGSLHNQKICTGGICSQIQGWLYLQAWRGNQRKGLPGGRKGMLLVLFQLWWQAAVHWCNSRKARAGKIDQLLSFLGLSAAKSVQLLQATQYFFCCKEGFGCRGGTSVWLWG